MQARSTTFLAAAALSAQLALSAPALASPGQPLPQPLPLPPAGWHDEPAAPQTAMDHARAAEPDSRPEWQPRERPMMHHAMPAQPAPRFAYTAEQRAAWIDDCMANQLPRQRRSGGVIGGVLGAVVGGVAGNRIADGSRLAGTLIGGGVGAVAGAVIGGAIDRGNQRDREDQAFAFCDDYLARYESGAMAQPGYGYGYGYTGGYAMAVPVMMVAVPMTAHRAMQREEIVEEWVEEVPVRFRQIPAAAAPRAPAKRVPLKPTPAK